MPMTLAEASRMATADPNAQKEPAPMPSKKPKSLIVRYRGPDPLHNQGVVAKVEPGFYMFPPNQPIEVKPVPLDKHGRALPFDREDLAESWDPRDMEFFQQQAKWNPGLWSVDGEETIPEKIVKAVKGKAKKETD